MTPQERRAFIDVLAAIPAKHRAWLASDDVALFAYYGWGIVLNSAQEQASADVFRNFPPGTAHLRVYANRSGKTTGLVVDHSWAIWRKWRYQNADPEDALAYRYKTLHAAPTGRLMGKAWELAESIISHSAEPQKSPITNRMRPAVFPKTGLFRARSGKTPDGSEGLWIECANNARLDFLSTHDGAGRMESDAWWLISWDEFPRHQPASDITLLMDQTFLPRSSDFMAPLIFSGTETDDTDPIFREIEEIAEANPRYWNIQRAHRSVNFSQSSASIQRQLDMSIDKEIAGRSVEGEAGVGGRRSVLPAPVITRAFDPTLPESLTRAQIEQLRVRTGVRFVSLFDHALGGDLNVVQTWAVPWPIPADRSRLTGGIVGVGLSIKKSSAHLTPSLQMRFLRESVEPFDPAWVVVDATAEGGLAVYRAAREERMPVVDCNFTGRLPNLRISNKEYGLQALQRMMSFGLDTEVAAEGWTQWDLSTIPEDADFGLLRFPNAGEWIKLRREMAVLRRDDEHQTQDRAMTSLMGAWFLWHNFLAGSTTRHIQSFNIVATRRRRARR